MMGGGRHATGLTSGASTTLASSPGPTFLIFLELGLVCEISMEPIIVGISMEMPSFTMTSFWSAHGQASSLVGILE